MALQQLQPQQRSGAPTRPFVLRGSSSGSGSSSSSGSSLPRWRCQGRRCVAVRATIPVPDQTPIASDLGWPTDFAQHYVRGKLIGQGSFGSVYLGIDLHTGKEVAVKAMPKQRGKLTRERTLQKLAKEVGILQRMQACRNAVRLMGCYEAADEVMVVTGLCSGGDLQKLSDDHGALPERAVALIAYEVLQVVEKCHDLGILHGDVKPANFVLADRTRNPLFSKDINLLFGAPWLLAIDFGCSQYLGAARFTKRTGTPVYMAPEIFDRDYHCEADVWSLGIMLYQLYARRFPYWRTYEECRHARLEEVAVLVAESPLLMDYGPWRAMSPEGLDFMRACLERDYTQRMSVTQALNHPWLMQWLPEDDLSALELTASLDSVGTSEDDEADGGGGGAARAGAAAAARAGVAGLQQQLQQQQQQHLQQQQGGNNVALPGQQLQHHAAQPVQQHHNQQQQDQQQHHQQQQQQQQVLLSSKQVQQQLAASAAHLAEGGGAMGGNAPGAYSSSSDPGGGGGGGGGSGAAPGADGASSSSSSNVVPSKQPADAAVSGRQQQ